MVSKTHNKHIRPRTLIHLFYLRPRTRTRIQKYTLTLENVAGTCPLGQLVALELGKVPLPQVQVLLVDKDVRLRHHPVALDVALALLVADRGQQPGAHHAAVVLRALTEKGREVLVSTLLTCGTYPVYLKGKEEPEGTRLLLPVLGCSTASRGDLPQSPRQGR